MQQDFKKDISTRSLQKSYIHLMVFLRDGFFPSAAAEITTYMLFENFSGILKQTDSDLLIYIMNRYYQSTSI